MKCWLNEDFWIRTDPQRTDLLHMFRLECRDKFSQNTGAHHHHGVQIRHLVHAGLTQDDHGAGGVQTSSSRSPSHLDVFTWERGTWTSDWSEARGWKALTASVKPGSRFLKPVPSCFLMLSNTTVLAGMFTPIANVSVAKSTWTCRKVSLWLTFGRWNHSGTDLDQTAREEHLDDLLQDGQDAAVVDGDASLQEVPHQQNLNQEQKIHQWVLLHVQVHELSLYWK